MKDLAHFEYTPDMQPVPEDPVVFTLRPLDFVGDSEMTAALSTLPDGVSTAMRIASRYIQGWRGGGQDPVNSRGAAKARLAQVMDGAPAVVWTCWLMAIAKHLSDRAMPSEEDAKKF